MADRCAFTDYNLLPSQFLYLYMCTQRYVYIVWPGMEAIHSGADTCDKCSRLRYTSDAQINKLHRYCCPISSYVSIENVINNMICFPILQALLEQTWRKNNILGRPETILQSASCIIYVSPNVDIQRPWHLILGGEKGASPSCYPRINELDDTEWFLA